MRTRTHKSSSYEFTFRVAGAGAPNGVEVSIDGADYRPCRFESGAWRLRWDGPSRGDDPIVAVIRPVGREDADVSRLTAAARG